mgnify:FL=1
MLFRSVADATCGRETLETLETLRGGCGAEVGSETGGLDAECSQCCALALWCHPGYRGAVFRCRVAVVGSLLLGQSPQGLLGPSTVACPLGCVYCSGVLRNEDMGCCECAMLVS